MERINFAIKMPAGAGWRFVKCTWVIFMNIGFVQPDYFRVA